MVREKMRRNIGKFYLITRTRFGIQYYQESGIFDVGTALQEPYLYWTRYRDYAYGFNTIKSARAMARKLLKEHGAYVKIINHEGAVIS